LDFYWDWTNTDDYKTINVLLELLASGHVCDQVIVFSEDASAALEAPTVEIVSWIYPIEKLNEERKEQTATDFGKFKAAISNTPEAAGGLVAGWSQHYFDHKGVRARRWTALIGWKSVEDHYACKNTKAFLDNIHWLMDNEHLEPVEMVHYNFAKVE
jgi:hypothetical protein